MLLFFAVLHSNKWDITPEMFTVDAFDGIYNLGVCQGACMHRVSTHHWLLDAFSKEGESHQLLHTRDHPPDKPARAQIECAHSIYIKYI